MNSRIYELATELTYELKKSKSKFNYDFSVDNNLKSQKDYENEILKTLYEELKTYLKNY